MKYFNRVVVIMEILCKRMKFAVVLFLGMISLLLIYDRMGSNIHRYVNNKTIVQTMVQNYPIVMNGNNPGKDNNLRIRQQISAFIPIVKSLEYETNKRLSFQEYLINGSVNMEHNVETERKLLVSNILQFESQYLVPMKKLSPNSKLLYPDHIKSITSVMPIGDNKCDNNYGSDLKVVIIVISRIDGLKRRQILRKTWAQRIEKSKDVRLYFAIGLSKDTEIQKQIINENKEFNDLLQWNFVDNYYNLTIKSLAILRWFSMNCFRTKFLYKIDDDCIVNVYNLLQFSSKAMQNTIYGHLWRKAFVDRNKMSKFFISKLDYRYNSYPDYTGGPWLMSGTVVPLLYETAITKSLPALPYEDVYITGVVANTALVKRKQLTGLIYFSKSMFNKVNNCWFEENIIFWQNLDDLMIENIWRNIENSQDLICVKSNGSTVYPKT